MGPLLTCDKDASQLRHGDRETPSGGALRDGLSVTCRHLDGIAQARIVDGDSARLGIPLASFAEGQLNVAYDLSGRNVMAQWNFAQTSAFGTKINYRAYVGESGMVSLGVSSRF